MGNKHKSQKSKTNDIHKTACSENASIDMLVSMGFDKEKAIIALQASNSNISVAVDYLTKECPPNNHSDEYISTNCFLSKCKSMQRMKQILNIYEQQSDMNDLDINIILNDFLHLLQAHNDDIQFQHIFDVFNINCNASKCDKIQRNYMNKSTDYKHKHMVQCFQREILDRIHCFYCHSFDIGNRINRKEFEMITTNNNTAMDDSKYNVQQSTQSEASKIAKFLHHKQKKNKLSFQHVTGRKFTQFEEYVAVYSLGHKFYYGYNGEYDGNIFLLDGVSLEEELEHAGFECISAKYVSLKEELTSNEIATLSMEQYLNEYSKAEIHFNSVYCKQRFRSKETNSTTWQDWDVHYDFTLHHVLSLMVYCNYTQLQYEFSKTYRGNGKDQHNNFYFMAKNIKMAVKKFGTRIKEGDIKSFYHGVGEQLIFPQYLTCSGGVSIHCPLSATSSFHVAVNFTNFNQGIIIEFGDKNNESSATYCSVSWLSDYVNESEYLFIQNNDDQDYLQINNIVDAQNGIAYDPILNALRYFHFILILNLDKASVYQTEETQKLLAKILCHLLSKSIPSYQPFLSLSKYAVHLFDTYLNNNKEMLNLDHKSMNNLFIFDVFWHSKTEWIKLKNIDILFPNIVSLSVFISTMDALVMEDIFMYLSDQSSLLNLKSINVNISSNCGITNVLQRYKSTFLEINYRIIDAENAPDAYLSINDESFSISKCGKQIPYHENKAEDFTYASFSTTL
eukprot:512334_1